MKIRFGLILLAAAVVCQAQYWKGHPENRDIFADYMDFGVSSAPGILKGKPINFIISGYSTMIPCVDEVTYMLAQHEKATGTSGLYKVISACKAGSSLLNYVGCPSTYTEGANYRLPIDKIVAGQTNVLLADQSPSGLSASPCNESDKNTDNITGMDDPKAEIYAVYMDTVTSRYLRDGFDKVYFNSHLYYEGRLQGMCFQWYGMYKFFKDHPKSNVFPGPYTGGISKSFYPTGFVDSNHPEESGPIAKIVGLGWYVTLAGEDALDEVMKPYLDSISSYNLGKFPPRDYTAPTAVIQNQNKQSDMPVSIKPGFICIASDMAGIIQIINLNGKVVYSSSTKGAGNFNMPRLKAGIYLVKVILNEKTYTGNVAFF